MIIKNNRFVNILSKYLIIIIAILLLTGYFSVAHNGYINYEYNQRNMPEEIINIPIIHSDGEGYYSYLPHYFINEEIASGKYFGITNPLSRPPLLNKYNIGEAIMILPFFLVAHLLSKLFGYPTDGYSFFYQHAAGLAGIFYVLIGLYLLKKILEKYFSKKITIITLVVIIFGTNLYHYATFDSVYSHSFAFFTFSALIFLIPKWYENPKSIKISILLGIVAGFIPLIRITNIIFLLFFPLYGITTKLKVKERLILFYKNYKTILLIIFFMVLVFVPQLLVWKHSTGQFFINSYGNPLFSEVNPYWYKGFNFLSPNLYGVLFSMRKGLFFWSPILLFILPGFFFIKRKVNDFFIPILIYVPLITYLNASWWCWWFGGSFGHRAFTESIVILAFLIASFYSVLKSKTTKITIYILSALFTVISIANMLLYWKGFIPFDKTNYQTYMDIFNISEYQFNSLLQNLKFTNYSIFIPITLIVVTIGFLILILFKKNKIIYISLIFLIFLDLFSMAYFYDNNSETSYLDKNLEDSQEIAFLNQDNELFRIFPVASSVSGYIFSSNKNIHLNTSTITGYVPLLLDDYKNITGLKNSSEHTTNWKELLKNNNVLSMLNTKYIIIPKPEDMKEFTDSISNIIWENSEFILNNSLFHKAEFKNSKLSTDGKEIIISGEPNSQKIFKVPIEIEENKNYIISFNTKFNKKIDSSIHFDFFGNNYDNPEQEFCINPDDIGEEYIEIEKIIKTNEILDNTDIYFRIFTNTIGELLINDLEIYEVDLDYPYDIVLEKDDILIIENKNYLPRFYFVPEIIEVNNIEESKEILWDENTSFNPSKTALVENTDFNKRNFNTENNTVSIIEYKNNMVKLDTFSNDDSFLIFSDTYYPGWKAYIDGKETKIYRTNGILKGIYIPKGNHEVTFKYIPSLFRPIAIISIITLFFSIITIIILFRRHKRFKKIT